jgi:CRISPR-associated protein Csx3
MENSKEQPLKIPTETIKTASTSKEIMPTYNITLTDGILKIGFGTPAQNDQIVKDVEIRLDEMVANKELAGGEVLRVNGPASLPVAMVLAHKLSHLYQGIACFDPKLGKYVVAIAHGDKYSVGDLVE